MKTILFLTILTQLALPQNSKMLLLFDDGFLPETIEYKRLIDSVGGSINTADLTAVDVFVKEISAIRSKIVRFNPFGGNNLTTALVPLIRGTKAGEIYGNNIDVNSGYTLFQPANYTRTGGLGDPLNSDVLEKNLRTGVTPSAISVIGQNDVCIGIYSLTDAAGNYEDIAVNSGYMYRIDPRLATDKYRVQLSGNNVDNANTTSIGCFIISRITSANFILSINGSNSTLTKSSTGEPTAMLRIFCRGVDNVSKGGQTGTHSTRMLSGYVIAKGLTGTELTLLYNAWNKLKTAFGR